MGRPYKPQVMSVFTYCDSFLAQCVHPSASMEVIYYHLSCQSSPWSSPSSSQRRQHCSPLPLLSCITLCSVFKPATEGTHSDNYSTGTMPHHKPGEHDMRWMVIWKLRGRQRVKTENESTEGYQKVRQIREWKSKMKGENDASDQTVVGRNQRSSRIDSRK